MEKYTRGILDSNEIIFAPKKEKLQILVCKKNLTSEISDEFILPDYLPEIRRLLKITPRIQIPSKYITSSKAEFSGNINWSVLYVSSNGELACTEVFSPFETTAEYDSDLNIEPDGSFEGCDFVFAENVIGRVTAPRKINLKCRLSHNISVYGEISTSVDIMEIPSLSANIKKLEKNLLTSKFKSETDDSIELEETVSLPEGTRAIACDGSVNISDITQALNGLVCKGRVNMKLFINKDGEPSVLEKSLQLESNIPIELDGDGWSFRVYGKLSEASVDQSENEALCKIRICVAAEALKNEPVLYTIDAFSTDYKCETNLKTISAPILISAEAFEFTHEGSAKTEGLSENAQLIDSSVIPIPESVVIENGRYILYGKCKYNAMYFSDGDYSSRDSEFPFRCELSEGDQKPADFSASFYVSNCSVRKEGENTAFTADITASVRIIGEIQTNCVSEIIISENTINSKSPAFTVAYISNGESLWDIAKRYSVDPEVLSESNGIKITSYSDIEPLDGIKYLII